MSGEECIGILENATSLQSPRLRPDVDTQVVGINDFELEVSLVPGLVVLYVEAKIAGAD